MDSRKNHTLTTTHTYNSESLPTVSEFDFLIIMGGPQSTLELTKYPYLRDEMLLAEHTIKANKPLLGICLGAQILAQALGGVTEKSPYKEVGTYPIELTAEGRADPLFKLFPLQFNVLHWHGEMPGTPANCRWLAKSAGCPRQAFAYKDRVYGFQFHLELTSTLIKEMMTHCAEDLTPGKFIRQREELLTANYTEQNQKLWVVLDYLSQFMI